MQSKPEWWFYHLVKKSQEESVPVIIEKCLEKEWRVLAVSNDEKSRSKLDVALWTYKESSFIGHAMSSDKDVVLGRQPVLISDTVDNLNNAQALILLNGFEAPVDANFDRIMVVFEEGDNSVIAIARKLYKLAKNAECSVNYFKQNNKGGWEKKS